MHTFLLCFLPLFVAMDIIGNLPVYMSLTSGLPHPAAHKVVRLAGITASIVGLLFIWFGGQIFTMLQISPDDFKISGGLVLFIIAVTGVLHDQPRHQGIVTQEHIGIVPIGVPLMVGPATLVTLLLLHDLHPSWAVVSGFLVNIALSLLVFHLSNVWENILQVNTIRAISKVMHFFLAAIAVMMIRVGIMDIITNYHR